LREASGLVYRLAMQRPALRPANPSKSLARGAARGCVAFAALAFLADIGGGAAAETLPDPALLYGGDIVFSVWRSGSEIGEHRVQFMRDGAGLIVRSTLDLAVKLLGITVYRYHYQSQETWRDDRLVALASAIDDDGTLSKVETSEAQGKLVVTGTAGTTTVAGPILPSTHWNAQIIGADRMLDTLNGKVDQIKLVPQGMETVPTGAGPRPATHYLYTGDIKAEVWYDGDGHWLKLRFPGKDGSIIDYVCTRCLALAP
jgi:hypothetical protein